MKGVYFGFFLIILSTSAIAQSGNFRSRATGNWSTASTWERDVNSNNIWGEVGVDENPSTVTPTSASGTITVRPNHTVTVTSNVTIDQTAVNSTGTLTVSNATLTIADGSGTDLTIYNDGIDDAFFRVNSGGIVELSDLATMSGTGSGNVFFNASSIYRHYYTSTEGIIPSANWNSTSRVEILGYTLGFTATSAGKWGQSFGDFHFNCPLDPSEIVNFAGLFVRTKGEFKVISTGSGRINFCTSESPTINIDTDLSVLGTSRLIIATSGTPTVNIKRDFIFSSTLSSGSNTNSIGSTTLNIDGNFTMNAPGGKLSLASGVGTVGNGILNIKGNFALTNGDLVVVGDGIGNINFIGTSLSHTYTNTGTISGIINYTVGSTNTLDLGTSSLTGDGSLTVSGSSFLKVGATDAAGAIQNSTTAGNIQVPVAGRTYASSSTIVYNGTGAQTIGNGFPSNVNLEISNLNGVTNNNTGVTNVVGNLTLTSGPLNIGSSNTLNIQSNFFTTGGTIGGDPTSNLTFSGSGTLNTLSFASSKQSINNLTVSRTAELVLGSDLTVSGTINLSGGNLNFTGHTLTVNGSSISVNATGLVSSSSTNSNLIFGGSTFLGSIPFSGSGNQLNNLTFGTNGGSYSWNSSVLIANQVSLNSGTLTHTSGLTMANNSTFVKAGGTYSGAALAVSGGNKFNLTYTGSGNTGNELPSLTTTLNNLKISSSGTITLAAGVTSLTVNGNLETDNGTFDSNSKDITVVGNFLSGSAATLTGGGTFTFAGTTSSITGDTDPIFGNLTISSGTVTFSRDCSIKGALVNNATISSSSGVTTTFSGTTSITGSGTTSFRNLSVSGTLTAPSTMNVAGTFANSGTFNHNNGSVVFNGTTSFTGTAPSFNNVSITGIVTAPSTWNIAGNLSNSGTFNNNNGTLVLNGTVSAQAITGTFNVNNINISNPSGVNNNGTINLSGVLTLISAGAFDADGSGSGNLIIKSTAVNAGGRIAALTTPGNFQGDVTVERFINNSGQPDFWRLLSMPITNGTVSKWKSNFPVSGNFTDPSPAGVNNVGSDNTQASIYFWNSATQAYAAIGSGTTTLLTSVSNNRGYYVYTFLTSDFTSSVKGPVQTGNLPIPISSTPNSYALIPNPYPSPIDWDNMDRTGLNSSMSLKNPAKASTSYVAGGPATNPPYVGWAGEVAIGQSFWIQSNGASSIGLTESAKTLSTFQFIREKEPQNYFKIALSSESQRDEAAIWFVDGATAKQDSEFDAPKMPNGIQIPGVPYEPYLNISTMVAEETAEFAINSVAPITCNTKFNINISDVAKGGHTLSFSDLDKMNLGYSIVLVDKFTRTERPVTPDLIYDFNVTADSASFGSGRFELRILIPGSPYLNSMVGPKISILNACDPATLQVSFKAEAGVDYQFMLNGVAVTDVVSAKQPGNVDVNIAREKLPLGNNSFSLVATSRLACDQFTYPKSLEFNNEPILPVSIETSGSLLLTDENTSGQWFKDGIAIENATTSSYMVTEPGEYFVQRDFGGCLVNSKALSISLESLSGQYMQAFPNPAKNQVNFILPSDVQRNLKSISMFDVKGVKIADSGATPELLNSAVKSIDVSNQKPGIYIIKIVSDKVHHLKFIKE
jgi:hypothetical protein